MAAIRHYDIFLSYRRESGAEARLLQKSLKERGLGVEKSMISVRSSFGK